jgi:Putative prokaryotic signal transducing protein
VQRLAHAPNIAIAQLWVDMLRDHGIVATVQRYFLSGISGDIPPDQCWPELWVQDDTQLAQAKTILHQVQHRPQTRWHCHSCGELVEGGFEQCWSCGAMQAATDEAM